MNKQYKIQLPKGKKVTMTNVDFEDGVMTVNVELENRTNFHEAIHNEVCGVFGKINNEFKEILKANGVTREKIEEMAKESIKELEKDCPDIWDKIMQGYREAICGKKEQKCTRTLREQKLIDEIDASISKRAKELRELFDIKEQKYEPKDGDFVYVKAGYEHIAIFKKEVGEKMYVYANWNMSFSVSKIIMDDSTPLCCIHDIRDIRPATEAEKKLLINKLAEKGKRWNEKEKRIENIEYIPEDGEFVHIRTKPFQSQGYLIPAMGIDIIIKHSDDEKIYPYADSVFGIHIGNTDMGYYLSDIIEIRPCTGREKKILIDKLAKANKKWNPKTKTIEDVRWRAEVGETFFYIDTDGRINSMNRDDFHYLWKRYDSLPERLEDERMGNVEYMLWKKGNYFKTREAAEKVAEQIREIFKNSKPE